MSSDVITHTMLGDILERLKRIEAKLSQPTAAGGVATDGDLDGPHGDPVVKKDPKRWPAENGSYVGCRFSECPADYLEAMAGLNEWKAQQDERKGTDDDKRKAKFNRLDAARARGWAQRVRDGYKAPVRSEQPPAGDDIPF